MTRGSNREYLATLGPRYRGAGRAERSQLLTQAEVITGYHRKYLIRALNRRPSRPRPPRGRPRHYGLEVTVALGTVWEACDRICSKRLQPFLPEIVPTLKRTGHLVVRPEIEAQLLTLSPATIDRRLQKRRQGRMPHGRTTTDRGSLLGQIPIRTFAQWDDAQPGFLEADLVAHCGTTTAGTYVRSLSTVDIATAWFEGRAILGAHKRDVRDAIDHLRRRLPVPLQAFDADNDSAFLNQTLLAYCHDHRITFTRSRPYKKNDQAHVEQKNGNVIRGLVGYDRFDSPAAVEALNAVYDTLRLYQNFFQPSLRLKSKTRHGARVTKHYLPAQTPYQRLQASGALAPHQAQQLEHLYRSLDPVALRNQLHRRLDELWKLRAR